MKEGECAYKVVDKLRDSGAEAWWVGGAPRDMLLARIPTDIDIATSALPAAVKKLFPKHDDAAEKFGAVTVAVGGRTFEVTTFREDDAASDGRHPESVRFGGRAADALRRDATVNALYFDPVSRKLIDPCGGESDLRELLVRFIGDPATRIRHDALRILRMIRLRATIAGQYHPETYRAFVSEIHTLSVLSGMRILEELEKLLACPHPETGLEDLWETGALKLLIPELHKCKGVPQPKDYHREGDVWEHLKSCTTHYTDDHGADVRLAVLFHDVGKAETFSVAERIRFDHHAEASAKIAGTVLRRLAVPNLRIRKIQWIIEHHMMMDAFQKLSEERKAHWYFHPWFRELLQLMDLDIRGTEPGSYGLYDSIIRDYDEFLNAHPRPPRPLLTGDEVMDLLGLKPGEEVGKILAALRGAQTRKEVTTKAEARKFIESYEEQEASTTGRA